MIYPTSGVSLYEELITPHFLFPCCQNLDSALNSYLQLSELFRDYPDQKVGIIVMFSVACEADCSLVHVTFEGHVDAIEAMQCKKEITALLKGIAPGFTLLTDMSLLGQMDYACSKEIQGMMDQFRQSGVRRIIRVSLDPKKDIGINIMSIIHYRNEVEILTVDTLQEAFDLIKASNSNEVVHRN